MPRSRKLPRGFWDTPEGRKALDKLQSRKITATDLAKELGTTEAAVYNAASKRRRVITASPMLVDQGFMDRVIHFAEDILGEAVTQRITQLEARNTALEEENRRLLDDLEAARTQSKEQAVTLESFQRRLTERTLQTAGPAKGD